MYYSPHFRSVVFFYQPQYAPEFLNFSLILCLQNAQNNDNICCHGHDCKRGKLVFTVVKIKKQPVRGVP